MYQRPDGLYEKIITINGKRLPPFRAKTEREVLKKITLYREKEKSGRTFKEIAEEWQKVHCDEVTYGTAKSYKAPCRRLIEHFDNSFMKQITPNDVNTFIVTFSKKGYAHKTVKNLILVANLIFSYAVMQKDIDISPTTHIKVPKNLKKSKRDMPSYNEIEIVKKSFNCTFGLFAYFLLFTGCRKGEALALQFKDIDVKEKIINISKSVYYISNKAEIKCPKTEAGNREIILMDILAGKMSIGKPNDYIFGDEKGCPISAKKFMVNWKKYCDETGLDITPHQLRHAYATILFEAGIDEKDAQELLGHTSLAMTRDIYTHISKTQQNY